MALNDTNNNGNFGAHSDAGSSESSGGRLGGGGSGSPDGLTLKKGPWSAAEDKILTEYLRKHGEGKWNEVQRNSGINRCGKSCRLRWANHLRANLKKGTFTSEEERIILELHAKYGNKWARMAAQLPGRTDNEIKNYWNTRIKKHKRRGLPLYPVDIQQAQTNTPASPMATTIPTNPTVQFQMQNQNQSHFALSPTTPQFSSSLSPPNQPTISPNLFELRSFAYRESHSFSLPLSTLTPQASNLLSQSTSTQMPDNDLFEFLMNFNTILPQSMTTQFETEPVGMSCLIDSVKSELPSSQFSQFQSDITSDSMLYSSETRRNIGLFDDFLEEVQACKLEGDSSMNSNTSMSLKDEKPSLDDYSRFGSSSSYLGPSEMNIGEEVNQRQIASTSVTEEWSKLVNFVPYSNMQVPEW